MNRCFYNFRITLHGFPSAKTFSGIFLVTIEPAPIVVLSPIVIPGNIILQALMTAFDFNVVRVIVISMKYDSPY